MADDVALNWFITECEKISHIKRLRIHTRLPVVIPSRVTNELCDRLKNSRLKTILVFHINHANELSPELNQACEKLKQANVLLLNQAVLLKGVNDSVEQQVKLAEALFDMNIQPYYLHLLDKVKGAGHFDLAEDTAKEIYQGMLTNLPGFLVPKLVREIGGETSKTPVLP
jgi:KamA family protein